MDRLAIHEFGVPSIVLMENAARNAAGVAMDMLGARRGLRVLVVCGTGNNGGDGLAIARHLSNEGLGVDVLLAGPRRACSSDCAVNLEIARRMGLIARRAWSIASSGEIDWDALLEFLESCLARRPALIVDALLGTGLSRHVAGGLARVIEGINAAGEPSRIVARSAARPGAGRRRVPHVLAVDVPSGLDGDTGRVLGVAVRATTTVTFVGVKPGFLRPGADAYVGGVIVADIGAPRALVERFGRPLERRRARARTEAP